MCSDLEVPAEGGVSSCLIMTLPVSSAHLLSFSSPYPSPPLIPLSASPPPPPSLLPAHSLSSPPPPPCQEEVSVFRLETYLAEPRRPETRRLRSFSSPPDTGQCSSSSSSSCFLLPPVAPPLPVGRLVSEEHLMILHVCWQLVVCDVSRRFSPVLKQR